MTSIASCRKPADVPEVRECSHAEFTGKDRKRMVCRSQDRVESIQVSDDPALWQDLCHEHQIPYKYEEGLEGAQEDPVLSALPKDDPRVQAIRGLQREARYARQRWSMDRRRSRLLQEERRLREEADQLLDDLIAQLAGGAS